MRKLSYLQLVCIILFALTMSEPERKPTEDK